MPKLPEEFADLERFTDWCLPDEEDRYQKRLSSTMAARCWEVNVLLRPASSAAWKKTIATDHTDGGSCRSIGLSRAMIAKIFFIAKTFRAQSTNYLRQEKSLRDHGGELGRPLFPDGT